MKIQETCSNLLQKLIAKKLENKSKKYCGLKQELPPNYDGFGHRYECLKKGVGVGKYQMNDALNQLLDEIFFETSFEN